MTEPKTSASQLKASRKYYHENREKLNENRREYFRAYNTKRCTTVKDDQELLNKKREYHREYMRKRRAMQQLNIDPNPDNEFDKVFLST